MSNPVPEPDAEPPEPPEPPDPPEPPVPPAATSGAGTPLVLLHAFPLDGRMWAPQVEAMFASVVADGPLKIRVGRIREL